MLWLACIAIAIFLFFYVDGGDFWDALGKALFVGFFLAVLIDVFSY